MTFELILLQTQRRSNWLDEIWCWSPCFQLLRVYFAQYIQEFVLLTTKDCRTTLPSLPGQRDTEERGYINASHHGGSSCRSTGSDGRFSLPSQSYANLETELSNYSPIEFANACTTHNAKRWRQTGKHGYNINTARILLASASKSDSSTQQLQNYRFLWQFISCVETRLMTTCDRSQCPELIYDFNGHCPRVKFVYYVNKYLLVASFKLEAAEIIRNSVTKDAFFYVPTHQDFNIYFCLMYTIKPISLKAIWNSG